MTLSSVNGLLDGHSGSHHGSGGGEGIWTVTYGHRGLEIFEGDHVHRGMESAEMTLNAWNLGYDCGGGFAHVYGRASISFVALSLVSFLLWFSWV